jgi:thiamine-phosphate pyrophosphorylase
LIPRLWYITDGTRGSAGRPLLSVIEQAAEGGVEAVVLRHIEGPDRTVVELVQALAPARERGLRVLLSRRADLALALGLDGVHLAQDALPIDRVRAWLATGDGEPRTPRPEAGVPVAGDGRARAAVRARPLIGYSAHSAAEATEAAHLGADYVTLSPIYATESKPGVAGHGLDWLADAARAVPVPVIALGGVTPERTRGIVDAGAWGIAAVAALGAAQDVAGAARAFARELSKRGAFARELPAARAP